MKTIRSAIKQAIFSKDFLIGFIGVIVVVFVSSVSELIEALCVDELLPNAFHNFLIENALVSDAMTLALPIIAALPFTASLVNDIKSGFIKCYLHRTSRKNYITSKCIASCISGGLVLALGILTSYIISAIAFITREDPTSKDISSKLFYAEFIKSIVLMFLSGAFWSLCGLTLATITGSKYMAYASPFIIYYVLIILYERYFDKFYVLYPKEWINPSSKWILGDWGVIMLLLGLIVATGAVFYYTVKRRISQL